jgi:hypothetical protein
VVLRRPFPPEYGRLLLHQKGLSISNSARQRTKEAGIATVREGEEAHEQ